MDEERERYEEARERVKALRGFYAHVTAYVVVNIGLFIINLLTVSGGHGPWWFYWPLVGWGIGLGAHAVNVLGGGLGRDWEERKVRELMENER